jgi:replication initiation and membrane attachment protein DnaB
LNFSEFQKKVLHLLVEIRNSLKDIKGSGHEQNECGDFNIKKCDDLDEFKHLEERIKSPEERRRLVRVLMNRKNILFCIMNIIVGIKKFCLCYLLIKIHMCA